MLQVVLEGLHDRGGAGSNVPGFSEIAGEIIDLEWFSELGTHRFPVAPTHGLLEPVFEELPVKKSVSDGGLLT